MCPLADFRSSVMIVVESWWILRPKIHVFQDVSRVFSQLIGVKKCNFFWQANVETFSPRSNHIMSTTWQPNELVWNDTPKREAATLRGVASVEFHRVSWWLGYPLQQQLATKWNASFTSRRGCYRCEVFPDPKDRHPWSMWKKWIDLV